MSNNFASRSVDENGVPVIDKLAPISFKCHRCFIGMGRVIFYEGRSVFAPDGTRGVLIEKGTVICNLCQCPRKFDNGWYGKKKQTSIYEKLKAKVNSTLGRV